MADTASEFATPDLSPAGQRALAEIKQLLHTGLTDWAVTNADTEAIHARLEALSRSDFIAICLALATTRDGATSFLTKYLVRGVLDHSEKMRRAWSEQLSWKLYRVGGEAAQGAEGRAVERELRRLAGEKVWDRARAGAPDAAT
jgi:hypothetical protein